MTKWGSRCNRCSLPRSGVGLASCRVANRVVVRQGVGAQTGCFIAAFCYKWPPRHAHTLRVLEVGSQWHGCKMQLTRTIDNFGCLERALCVPAVESLKALAVVRAAYCWWSPSFRPACTSLPANVTQNRPHILLFLTMSFGL